MSTAANYADTPASSVGDFPLNAFGERTYLTLRWAFSLEILLVCASGTPPIRVKETPVQRRADAR
jgi:hypothetical protein